MQDNYRSGFGRKRGFDSRSGNNRNNDICRDYLRNVCTRGDRCKFSHQGSGGPGGPGVQEDMAMSASQMANGYGQAGFQDNLVFCHDFQNSECRRSKCRFLHANRDEEEEFKASGYLPPHVRDQAIRKGVAADMPAHFGHTPICKDFLNSECHRANNCKYRHVTPMQYDKEMNHILNHDHREPNMNHTDFGGPFHKRRRDEAEMSQDVVRRGIKQSNGEEISQGNGRADLVKEMKSVQTKPSSTAIQMLQEENLVLKQRIEALKKQVQDLSTTNEFLLDQNAQLRLGVKTSVQAAQAAPQPPPTALTVQSIPPGQAAIVAPASIAQAVVSSMPQQTVVSLPQAVASMPPQSAAGTITMAALTAEGPPPTVSLPVPVPATGPTGELMSCHPAAPQGGPPPPSASNAVHVQETRLISYPITSIHQAI